MTKRETRTKNTTARRVKKILVPTDFSAAARAAFRHALDLAAQAPAEIILLHVLAPAESRDGKEATVAAKKKLVEFCKNEGVGWHRCKRIVREGVPFFEITQSAKEAGADLIILGRDHPSATTLSEGHTAERVARYATCPVLLVRETDGRQPEWA